MSHLAWADALHAIRLIQSNPSGLGGIWLRARIGPPRDRFINHLIAQVQLPVARIAPTMTDEALFGGLDVTQTLANGAPVFTKGLLGQGPRLILLSTAERLSAHMAAKLADSLDSGDGHMMLALDEGVEDEAPPSALTDRLAFHISLDGLSVRDCGSIEPKELDPNALDAEAEDPIAALTTLSARLGVSGLRAPQMAVRAAKAGAAMGRRSYVSEANLELAARLVIGPRATALPVDPSAEVPPPPDETTSDEKQPEGVPHPPDDLLLEATLAALPPDLLAKLADRGATRNAAGTSAHGSIKKGLARGRPLPTRKGKPDGRNRIDLIATLRSAAPWQTLRQSTAEKSSLQIRAEDIHLRCYQSRSDRLLIFTVDASGSAAMNRLAEAKGAIELLLADAYACRDHVTLIAFNKESAEQLLPPTRSLVRTKRELAQLPGGGGTPLAAGIKAAIETAEQARRKGLQPAIILIADGRANIDLDGAPDRARALADALSTSKLNTAPGVVIDISKRPEPQLQQVAAALGVSYTPMPFVNAGGLSKLVTSELALA